MRGLMADARRFARAKNFRVPGLYDFPEFYKSCCVVVPRPDADEQKPGTLANSSARGEINLTFDPTSYTA